MTGAVSFRRLLGGAHLAASLSRVYVRRPKGDPMNRYGWSLALAVVSGGVATAALAQAAPGGMAGAMDMSAVPAASVTWTDAKIPGFPPRMKMGALNGTPAPPGAPI